MSSECNHRISKKKFGAMLCKQYGQKNLVADKTHSDVPPFTEPLTLYYLTTPEAKATNKGFELHIGSWSGGVGTTFDHGERFRID